MKRKILIAVVVIAVAAIWFQSVLPSEISSQESGWFTEHIFRPLAEWLGIDNVSSNTVRKLAHGFEYMVLGLLTMVLWKGKVAYSFQMCFLVAFLDETIQLLSKRGSGVLDVWIDIGGTIMGIVIILLIEIIRNKKCEDGNEST